MNTFRPTKDHSLLSGFVPEADQGGEGAARIGHGILDSLRVQRFNEILQRISPNAPTLIAGQIAAAARRLLYADDDVRRRGAASIARRLARLSELESLGSDLRFGIDTAIASRIRTLIAYVDQVDDLIPDTVPGVGQLDDAILVDLLLQDLGPLLAEYADFCSFRRQQAEQQGLSVDEVTIDCDDWIAARRREFESARDQRRTHYVQPFTDGGFHIG